MRGDRHMSPAAVARTASTGAVPKPIHLGSLSRQVTAPGQTRVTIPIGSKGKRLLKRYKQARLVVRTYLVPGTLHLLGDRVWAGFRRKKAPEPPLPPAE